MQKEKIVPADKVAAQVEQCLPISASIIAKLSSDELKQAAIDGISRILTKIVPILNKYEAKEDAKEALDATESNEKAAANAQLHAARGYWKLLGLDVLINEPNAESLEQALITKGMSTDEAEIATFAFLYPM